MHTAQYDSEPRVHSEGRPAAGRGVDAARQHDGDAAGGDVAGGEEAAAEDGGGQEGGRAQEARFGNILHTTGVNRTNCSTGWAIWSDS